MSYGLHISQGNHRDTGATIFYFVGSVPAALMDTRKPTRSDVMGGRVDFETGLAYVGRIYYDVETMVADAKAVGAALCSSPGCSCRKLFQP